MENFIEAILFDVGGTLRRTTPRDEEEKTQILSRIPALLGFEADADAFARQMTERFEAYNRWSDETLVGLDEGELWVRWMLPELPAEQVRPRAHELHRIWRESTGKRAMLPEVREIMQQLFRRGYRLGIVSNTTSCEETPKGLEALGIAGCFDVIILSCDVGVRKPDPEILRLAARRMAVDPGRCAYVGDNPYRDVVSARQAGFARTVVVRHPWKKRKTHSGEEPTPDVRIETLHELLSIFPPRESSDDGRRQSTPAAGHGAPSPAPRYAASLSTMWGVGKFHAMGDFFIAAERMGFEAVELNHMVDSAMLAGVDLRSARIGSIHEPCPADISTVTLKQQDWLVSSLEEDRRQQGVAAVRRSIDLAQALGVSVIVMHAGMIPQAENGEAELRRLYDNGQASTTAFEACRQELVHYRAGRAAGHLEAVIRSLRELLVYAGRAGVHIGLENRYHYLDIPSQDEMEVLLQLAGSDRLGFIYDCGHAQAMDQLGFYPHEGWLQRFASRMLGTHLHDVRGIDDHWPPGMGEVDFRMVARYLPEEAFRTCEIMRRQSAEAVRAGLTALAKTGCIRQIE